MRALRLLSLAFAMSMTMAAMAEEFDGSVPLECKVATTPAPVAAPGTN